MSQTPLYKHKCSGPARLLCGVCMNTELLHVVNINAACQVGRWVLQWVA